jgi:hypothetical protein
MEFFAVIISGKVKVKFSLCVINWATRCEDVWGTRWRSVVNFTLSRRFTPGKISPCIHWIGGWVTLRDELDAVEKSKVLPFAGIQIRVVQPSTRRSTD